ncbi:MAG: type III secretion system chaperone [Pseudomonadota bacterium]
MQEKYTQILHTYANNYDFSCSIDDDTAFAILNVSGKKLHIALQKDMASIIISCAIAPIPEQNKEKVYGELLKLHNCLLNSHHGVFGLDSENKVLTLQRICPLRSLDDDGFAFLICNFLVSVLEILEGIYLDLLDWECSEVPSQDNDSLAYMAHMLRV